MLKILGCILFFSSAVLADDASCLICHPNDACSDQKQYGFLHSAQNCLTEPCGNIPWKGFADIAFLYFQAREDYLEFTANNTLNPAATAITNLNVNAKDIYPDFPWEPAFKVTLGLSAYNNWDLQGRWTSFHTNFETTSDAGINPAGIGLLSLWSNPMFYGSIQSNPFFTFAASNWNLYFNTIDIELGDLFQITKALSLRLHGGLKGVFINQIYRIRYTNGKNTANPIVVTTDLIRFKNQVKGAGPRIGFDSKWLFGKGVYLLADGSAGLILQYYKLKRTESAVALHTPVSSSTTLFNSTLTHIIWTWKPEAELQLGLGWGHCLGKTCNEKTKRAYLGCEISYEVQYYLEQSLFARTPDPFLSTRSIPTKGDLFLHGLNVSLNLEY